MKKDFKAKRLLPLMEAKYEEIKALNPTFEEILEYADSRCNRYGVVVTYPTLWGPRLHNAWRKRIGGSIHIDIGFEACHIKLDKHNVDDFINFIKERRQK